MRIRSLLTVAAALLGLWALPSQACSGPSAELWVAFKSKSVEIEPVSKQEIRRLADRFAGVGSRCFTFHMAGHIDGAEARSGAKDLGKHRVDAVERLMRQEGLRFEIVGREDHADRRPMKVVPLGQEEMLHRRVHVYWVVAPGGYTVGDPYVHVPGTCFGPSTRYFLADGTDCGYVPK